MNATKPASLDPIGEGTGRAWSDWLEWLEAIGARELPHKEIARRIRVDAGTSGWWAQYVTVAYEQHIGRRVPGQTCEGTFQVSVTRTLDCSMDEAIEAWALLAGGMTTFNGVEAAETPRRNATDKWRHWRAPLVDGTRLVVSASQKAPRKALLSIMHEKLADADAVEQWRSFWKEMLSRI